VVFDGEGLSRKGAAYVLKTPRVVEEEGEKKDRTSLTENKRATGSGKN